MQRRDAFDLYTDYLLAGFGQATATGLSSVLDHLIPHDYFSDFLSQKDLDSRAFWKEVKPLARKIEGEGLFLNADAGFDTQQVRAICHQYGIIPNFAFNPRNGSQWDREDYFDELLGLITNDFSKPFDPLLFSQLN